MPVGASQVVLVVKNLLASAGNRVRSPGQEVTLEEGMVTPSNILAWRIPRTKA